MYVILYSLLNGAQGLRIHNVDSRVTNEMARTWRERKASRPSWSYYRAVCPKWLSKITAASETNRDLKPGLPENAARVMKIVQPRSCCVHTWRSCTTPWRWMSEWKKLHWLLICGELHVPTSVYLSKEHPVMRDWVVSTSGVALGSYKKRLVPHRMFTLFFTLQHPEGKNQRRLNIMPGGRCPKVMP
jgi:hypothetical protein